MFWLVSLAIQYIDTSKIISNKKIPPKAVFQAFGGIHDGAVRQIRTADLFLTKHVKIA